MQIQKVETGLQSPSQRLKDQMLLKQGLDQYGHFKTQHEFYGKRQKTIKGGWRHGITGVQDVEPDSKFFDLSRGAEE